MTQTKANYNTVKKTIGLLLGFLVVVLLLATLSISSSQKANAAPVLGFNAGRIIDDGVFTNALSMNATDIQSFLNSKVPNCDTWGTKPSEFGGGTRAAWGTARGMPPPYVCLRDYTEGGKTAAQIIADTAVQFQINPQVLLVVLQKEQGLVTDTWPLTSQYRTATGYGCPDTAACDSQYFGLTNQIQWTARMYRSIMNASPGWYTPYIVGNNTIRFSPDSNCPSSVVNIENRATQALYNYTPYQPNQAALNAGYGTGDSCSSYGNRNFYLYFTDWFGSVRAVNGSIVISHALTTSHQSITAGDTLNAWYEISNTAGTPVNVGGVGVCGRLNGQYYDFGFSHQNTIAANGKLILSYNKRIESSGTLELFVCSYNDALGGWASAYYPYNTSGLNRSLVYTVSENPLVTSGVSINPVSPAVGQQATATFTVRNNSNTAVSLGSLTVAGRTNTGVNVDFPIVNDVIIPANSQYVYSRSRVFTQPGSGYSFYIANWNGVWSTSYPKSSTPNTTRSLSGTIKDNPLLTTGVSLSQASPVAGQPVTATLTISNASNAPINIGSLVVAGRSPSGANVDFPLVNDVIIPANGVYTYSQVRSFTQTGTYTFYVANWNGVWSTNNPKSNSSDVIRILNAIVR